LGEHLVLAPLASAIEHFDAAEVPPNFLPQFHKSPIKRSVKQYKWQCTRHQEHNLISHAQLPTRPLAGAPGGDDQGLHPALEFRKLISHVLLYRHDHALLPICASTRRTLLQVCGLTEPILGCMLQEDGFG
jgi:hypothetical protein